MSFSKLAAEILRRLGAFPLRPRYFSSSLSSSTLSTMDWSTSVLTPLSSDTEPCIAVTFTDAKYIFNAGENICRSALQTSRNWRKTRALFLTQAKIDKISGLGGLIMNAGDARCTNELDIFGPPGTAHILASMRSYLYRDSIKIRAMDVPILPTPSEPTPFFVDKNITAYSIPIFSTANPAPPELYPQMLTPIELKKRKRSPSPSYARKRPSDATDSKGRPVISDRMSDVIRKPGFRPEDLSGKVAAEWRELVIWAMFPSTNLPDVPSAVSAPPEIFIPEDKMQRKILFRPTFTKDLKIGEGQREIIQPNSKPISPIPTQTAYTSEIGGHRKQKAQLPRGFQLQLPPFDSDVRPVSYAYIIVGPRFRGKFNAKKAAELGVFRGDRGTLARGESVTVKVEVDGETVLRTVTPDQVLAESDPPAVVIVLDIPSVSCIPSLLSSFKSSAYYRRFWSEDHALLKTEDYSVRTVYHMCGDGVLENEDYKAFMNGFSSDTHHIISSRDHCPDPVTFTSAAYYQLRLNQLDENMFPLPKFSLFPKRDISSIPGLPVNCQPFVSGLDNLLRPYAPPTISPEIVAKDIFHPVIRGERTLGISSELERCTEAVRNQISQGIEQRENIVVPGSEVGVVTLGTGGSLPSKYRNVLSTLIRIPFWGNILLDAGEGTWGQMARHFGLDDGDENSAWQVLRDLKCIFISHMHADHHIGLAQILAKRQLLNPPPDEPLYIVSIRGLHLYIRELSDIHDLGLGDAKNGIVSVMSESIHYRERGRYINDGRWSVGGNESWLDYQTSVDNARLMCRSLGLSSFKTVDMHHGCRCYGAVITHEDGWSIAFSGDTRPTQSLVDAGSKVTVLIHEATMADEELELAQTKGHSTIRQAIDVGKSMSAQHILLTHFSARYSKMPVTEKRSPSDPVILPAFDHLDMSIGTMWKMSHYIPILEGNVTETSEDDGDEQAPQEPEAVDIDWDNQDP